jgi:hypothetical protein
MQTKYGWFCIIVEDGIGAKRIEVRIWLSIISWSNQRKQERIIQALLISK